WLVALQHEGAGPNDALGGLQVPELLHDFGGDDPGTPRVSQHVDQPDKGLLQEELHRIAVHNLDPVHRLQHKTHGIPRFRQEAVIGKLHVIGYQLTTMEGWFVMPLDALAQMEDVGGLVGLLPALRQMGLDREGAGAYLRTDVIADQRAVGEAQGGIGLKVEGEMGVEVRRIIAAYPEDAPAL